MRPGPAPKPSALKILAGNPGHRRLNDREPEPKVIEKLPRAPREFSEHAAKTWREIGNGLISSRLLTELGMPALFRYCTSADIYRTARLEVEKAGAVLTNSKSNAPYISPYYFVQTMAAKDLGHFEAEFGMTPASATRVKTANPKQLDLFAQLFETDDEGGDSPLPDDELIN